MRIYAFDGKCYLRLEDVHKLLSREVQKASDGRDHYVYLTKDERVTTACAINHLHSLLNEDDLACAVTVNEHKRVIDRTGKYGRTETPSEWAVVSIDPDDKFFYFRKWCKSVPKHEGEAMPIFSDFPEDAMSFASKGMANHVADKIAEEFDMFVRVVPKYYLEDETLLKRLREVYDYNEWKTEMDAAAKEEAKLSDLLEDGGCKDCDNDCDKFSDNDNLTSGTF